MSPVPMMQVRWRRSLPVAAMRAANRMRSGMDLGLGGPFLRLYLRVLHLAGGLDLALPGLHGGGRLDLPGVRRLLLLERRRGGTWLGYGRGIGARLGRCGRISVGFGQRRQTEGGAGKTDCDCCFHDSILLPSGRQ